MVTSIDDILEELRYARPAESAEQELALESDTPGVVLSALEQEVMDCFKGGELCLPDTISQQLNRPSAEVSATLMGLEIKRLIAKRADGRFEAR